jgi:aspartate/methionine/tyrosine aminotransferase
MSVSRLAGISGFAIDEVAARAGSDPEVLRMENLDTDLRPPDSAIAATRAELTSDNANSYLPFTGRPELCTAVAEHLERVTRRSYDPRR